MLFCQEHCNKFKEYACLTCDQSICPDCLLIGKHKGHEADTIHKDFEKLGKDFKGRLAEHEEVLKASETKKTLIINYLLHNEGKLLN